MLGVDEISHYYLGTCPDGLSNCRETSKYRAFMPDLRKVPIYGTAFAKTVSKEPFVKGPEPWRFTCQLVTLKVVKGPQKAKEVLSESCLETSRKPKPVAKGHHSLFIIYIIIHIFKVYSSGLHSQFNSVTSSQRVTCHANTTLSPLKLGKLLLAPGYFSRAEVPIF